MIRSGGDRAVRLRKQGKEVAVRPSIDEGVRCEHYSSRASIVPQIESKKTRNNKEKEKKRRTGYTRAYCRPRVLKAVALTTKDTP